MGARLACRCVGVNKPGQSSGASLADADPMLKFLFPRLTPAPERGIALFDAVTATAREPHWYVAGEVPDTLEGRFRMLATIVALVLVRLERCGEGGNALSVAVTERFIEVMESEHRELGLGDPKLGRTVRKLVAALAHRVDIWRSAADGAIPWTDAARQSVYTGENRAGPLDHSAVSLRTFWTQLQAVDLDSLAEGRME